jgi:hypothetical protein
MRGESLLDPGLRRDDEQSQAPGTGALRSRARRPGRAPSIPEPGARDGRPSSQSQAPGRAPSMGVFRGARTSVG